MKKQLFFLFSLIFSIQTAFAYKPQVIYVQTPYNQTITCYETETAQNVFWQCRQKQLCSAPTNSLTLLFGNFEIKEGTECSYSKRLMDFGIDNREAFIRQPAAQQTPPPLYSFQTPSYTEYVILKTPSGELLYFSPKNTFAQAFERCRLYNYCWQDELEIVYNNYVIKEYSSDANYTFDSYGQHVHHVTNNPAIIIQKQAYREQLSFFEALLCILFGTNH